MIQNSSKEITEDTSTRRGEYRTTIGIECHVQLKTKTKLFSGAGNDAKEAPPNTLINHIDVGLPGALPVLNKEAIVLAIKAAKALNSKAAKFSKFDRKHYFYPDLPMGYQITQYDEPIILGGYIKIYNSITNQNKTIHITRAHLEADAGKNVHPAGKNYSLIDLNRAGTPLLEIVSEPEMHSDSEARLYCEKLYLLMRYADVTEGNLYYGNMRFDVNVSVSRTKDLGVRTEIKNLNSFRSIQRAINYEIKRQIELIGNGQKIIQETRGFDDQSGSTYSLRSKENADDYRYMPDPDLPPIVLEDDYIKSIESRMGLLPDYYIDKLKKLNVDESSAYILLDYNLEAGQGVLDYVLSLPKNYLPQIIKWIVNIEVPLMLKSRPLAKDHVSKVRNLYISLVDIYNEALINSNSIKELIAKLFYEKSLPTDLRTYITKSNLLQNSNSDDLIAVVREVLRSNQKAYDDYRNGELKAIGFLIGQVMKATKGSANPALVKNIIEKFGGE